MPRAKVSAPKQPKVALSTRRKKTDEVESLEPADAASQSTTQLEVPASQSATSQSEVQDAEPSTTGNQQAMDGL